MYFYNYEDRKDLQQEIILQLWKSYSSFRGDSLRSTWMYKVAVNTAITYLKKEKRGLLHYKDNLPDLVSDEYTGEKDVQWRAFYQAAQQLNQIEKALVFYYMEGQSHKETASHLGISEVNARVKLNRTKDKIQKIIKKLGYEF
ncbi:RNA polymerase sigma factor [Flavobacterium sp. UBA4197]|uniref:RNA polymerase sigma factor n=1 Tax=Flavobacterium sp. UBA4197 TaxID=1946546 RepID=UPI0039C89EEB